MLYWGLLWRESGQRTVAGKVARVGTLFAGTGCEGEERDGEDVGELHFLADVRAISGGKRNVIQVVNSSFGDFVCSNGVAEGGRWEVFICLHLHLTMIQDKNRNDKRKWADSGGWCEHYRIRRLIRPLVRIDLCAYGEKGRSRRL